MFYKWTRGCTQLFWDIKGDQPARWAKVNDLFLEVFGEMSDGTFVEIGAHDGINGGVTLPLADLGWEGMFVEANPDVAQICANNHSDNPNVTVVSAAVVEKLGKGNVTLWGSGMGATCNEGYREIAKDISWAGIGTGPGKSVRSVTLEQLLVHQGIKKNFELLSVDVEGNEPEVFEGFDLTEWMPKMLVVEMTDGHPDFTNFTDLNRRYKKLREHIVSAGYTERYRDIINTVYVRNS